MVVLPSYMLRRSQRQQLNMMKRLFQMINDLPTIFEVDNHNSSRSKSSGAKPRHSESHTKASKMSPPPKEEDESGDEEEDDEQDAVWPIGN
ncbi:PREDICTED: PHD finger protein ALFIN-LIKE 7-like [Camelina sativa]|uniref:PHD finger protein ALFIN-LIKE 7-like n=1 Tax=Camelina sativa TaxID=90675 RepID=A0ABM1R2D0_CAMSA|nr:PREDICTED: PHD finger protein ALFIN-LIKE 7-like [Camelina sativa]